MKLVVTKLTFNLPAILIVVLIGGVVFYQSIERMINHNVDEVLSIRKEHVIELLNRYKGESPVIEYGFASIHEIDKDVADQFPQPEVFKDTAIYNPKFDESIYYRQLDFIHNKGEKYYRVSIRKAMLDSHLVLKSMLKTIFLVCLAMSVVIIMLNLYIFDRFWNPFHNILKNLQAFNLDNSRPYKSTKTRLEEFRQLDETIQEITNNLQQEYDELKDFTGYLTHELQTPLAVISGQIDVLMQDKSLSKDQLQSINTIRNTVQGMSRFEEALILLKRIDMGQFSESEPFDFSDALNAKLDQTEELIHLKNIRLEKDIDKAVTVNIHPDLAETLLNNIISNSIRHNIANGFIRVSLSADALEVTNSVGTYADDDGNKKTDFISSRGLGVGQSIIKSVCLRYGFKMQVDTNNGEFKMRIGFNS